MGVVHCERLSQSSRITILLGATVTGLHFDHKGGRVVRLTTRSLERTKEIAPKQVVLACGGLETTRLLLAAFRSRTDLFGGQDGALGRYYMGHMSGKIADIVLSDPERAGDLDFFMHEGAYVRRKFSLAAEVQAREQLRNISFWADNRPFHAVDHRSGVLSAAWLTLFVKPVGRLLASEGVRKSHVGPRPYRWLAHVGNVARSPLATGYELTKILHARYLSRPQRPGFLLRSKSGRYSLHYHSEQSPNRNSRVTLS